MKGVQRLFAHEIVTAGALEADDLRPMLENDSC